MRSRIQNRYSGPRLRVYTLHLLFHGLLCWNEVSARPPLGNSIATVYAPDGALGLIYKMRQWPPQLVAPAAPAGILNASSLWPSDSDPSGNPVTQNVYGIFGAEE